MKQLLILHRSLFYGPIEKVPTYTLFEEPQTAVEVTQLGRTSRVYRNITTSSFKRLERLQLKYFTITRIRQHSIAINIRR